MVKSAAGAVAQAGVLFVVIGAGAIALRIYSLAWYLRRPARPS